MAFQEAGSPAPDDPSSTGAASRGLAFDWSLLKQDGCPRCGDELVEFPHIELWKCTCGFKIRTVRKNEIAAESGHYGARRCGFSLGLYDQESPF